MPFSPISRRTQPLEWNAGDYLDDTVKTVQEHKPPFPEDKKILRTPAELMRDFQKPSTSAPILKSPELVELQDVRSYLNKVERKLAHQEKDHIGVQNEQRELRALDNVRAQERIKEIQEDQKALHKEFDEVWEGINEHSKRSKIVGWFDTATSMGFLAMMVLSIGLAIVTGGASLGPTAGMVMAIGGAKGAASIASGVTQYKGQVAQADMAGVQHKREANQKEIQITTKDLKNALESLNRMAKLTREYLTKLFEEQVAAISRNG